VLPSKILPLIHLPMGASAPRQGFRMAKFCSRAALLNYTTPKTGSFTIVPFWEPRGIRAILYDCDPCSTLVKC
jgi:hypothetical protein